MFDYFNPTRRTNYRWRSKASPEQFFFTFKDELEALTREINASRIPSDNIFGKVKCLLVDLGFELGFPSQDHFDIEVSVNHETTRTEVTVKGVSEIGKKLIRMAENSCDNIEKEVREATELVHEANEHIGELERKLQEEAAWREKAMTALLDSSKILLEKYSTEETRREEFKSEEKRIEASLAAAHGAQDYAEQISSGNRLGRGDLPLPKRDSKGRFLPSNVY